MPSMGSMALSAHSGTPSGENTGLRPLGQQRFTKWGRGRPTCGEWWWARTAGGEQWVHQRPGSLGDLESKGASLHQQPIITARVPACRRGGRPYPPLTLILIQFVSVPCAKQWGGEAATAGSAGGRGRRDLRAAWTGDGAAGNQRNTTHAAHQHTVVATQYRASRMAWWASAREMRPASRAASTSSTGVNTAMQGTAHAGTWLGRSGYE